MTALLLVHVAVKIQNVYILLAFLSKLLISGAKQTVPLV
jgi:hypothetical protein